MLKLYDQNHNAIGHIRKYKDLCIESDAQTGDKTLSFTYLARHHEIKNEFYIDDGTDEYVVKEVPVNTDGFPQIVAVLNLEELEAKPWGSFSVEDSTIDDAARLALAGTGWTVGECTVTKKRSAGMLQVTSKDVIDKLCTAFMCERVYDTKAKKVHFYDKVGSDKGVYFLRGLNLKKLNKKSDSYDYYTRIIPVGANNLTIESVNDGKNYLENYQYSNKVKTYIWKDESYTNAQALMEDAGLKLEDLSKPVVSYSADVVDLAKQKAGYSVLSYDLGDAVTLIDGDTGIREKQRIVKLKRYPQDHSKDACELANTVLTFEEMQQKYQEAAEIINTVVAGDGRYTGTINVSDILNFEQGLAGSSTVSGMQGSIDSLNSQLSQLNLTVGSIQTNYLKVDEADLKYATIQQLSAVNATVGSIQGDYASFKSTVTEELAAHTGQIDYIQGDLANYKTVVSDELLTAKGWMAQGAIGDAQISSLSANKLTAGTVDTSIITVAGTAGNLRIVDNTIQIKDASRIRVQAGKDASGDYSLSVWDADGNLIWDALGATEKTIQRPIIRDSMVSEDAAVKALKIDFQSFETALTKQGVTISGTVVQVGSKTLNVVLSEQSQTIEEQGEKISDHTAQIEANQKSIALKVSTQEFTAYKTTVTASIDTAKEEAVSAAGADAAAKADAALEDAKEYTSGQMEAVNTHLTTLNSSITALQGQIALKVEQTDVEQCVSEAMGSYSTTEQMNAAITASADSITQSVAKTYAKQSDLNTISGKVTSLETWKAEASQKITQEGIIATVGNYYAYKTDLDSVEGRVTEAESTIAQHADEISLRVEKSGIISAINQTAETIKISAGKIDLSGYVTVTNLATAGATTINGANITTGTISADRIDVTGLFAKDITATGTIRGVNLIGATGSFSGEIVANEGRIGNYEIYDDSLRAGGIGIYATDKAGVGAFIEVYEVVNERYTTLYQSDGIAFRDYKRSSFFGGLRVNSTYDTDTWIYSSLELGYLQYSTGAVHSTIGMDGRTGLIYTEGEIEVGSATTSGAITSSLTSGTYLAGNKGTAIINSTAAAGAYAMLFKLNSTNGVFTGGTYQNKLEYHYTANATINAGTNSPTKTLVLMDESGNSTFPGTFSAAGLIKGSAGASITGAITATGNVSAGGAFYEAGTSLTAKYMRFTTANGYPGFNVNGNVSNWIRTTQSGLIPYQSGGHGSIGTSSWPFNEAYIKTIYCTNFAGTTNQRPCCSYNTNGRRVAYVASRGANGTYRGMFNGQFSDNASVTTYQSLGVVVSSSDVRLKKNVQDTEVKALPMINRIKMRQFDWKDSGAHQDLGFVADELEMLHPRFATGGGYDEEGNMDIKCVNEFYLLGYLTKAIQEISQEMLTVTAFSAVTAKVQDHESRICAAESKVTQMVSREESLQFQLGQAFIKIKELENQISELQTSA